MMEKHFGLLRLLFRSGYFVIGGLYYLFVDYLSYLKRRRLSSAIEMCDHLNTPPQYRYVASHFTFNV